MSSVSSLNFTWKKTKYTEILNPFKITVATSKRERHLTKMKSLFFNLQTNKQTGLKKKKLRLVNLFIDGVACM